MKVIYEFQEPEEAGQRRLFELSNDMFLSLSHIGNYIRSIQKYDTEDDLDKILEAIKEYVWESRINEID